jgi:anthranilate/para-aminobenzoate synthase component I
MEGHNGWWCGTAARAGARVGATIGGVRPLAVRLPLPGSMPVAAACLLLRGDAGAVALAGDWAGVTALLASEPVRVARPDQDPFALLAEQPRARPAGARVGGGWLGVLGFGLLHRVERVPPAPPRPVPRPAAQLAFHDHVVVRDGEGRWWFEALVTPARAAALARRYAVWRARLAGPAPRPRPVDAGPLRIAGAGAAGHLAAVAEARERIAAGEVFQVNLCLRLDGAWRAGDPLDLFASGVAALAPPHAAFVAAADGGAVVSLSPERFLRREGRAVLTEPVKGTGADPVALAASDKDRAENVMIADLMRNDLGRVCAFGTVRAAPLAEPQPGPGVWHLVSTVRGVLRDDTTDADLLRAAFPPGSCTGAPKVQAMRVLHELEGTGREAYTGAIGLASPLAGLDLNVAIRTFEVARGRVWFGAGGGIVFDSEPEAELREALAKAAAPAAAVGLEVDARAPAPPGVTRTGTSRRPGRRARAARPRPWPAGDHPPRRRRAPPPRRAPRPAARIGRRAGLGPTAGATAAPDDRRPPAARGAPRRPRRGRGRARPGGAGGRRARARGAAGRPRRAQVGRSPAARRAGAPPCCSTPTGPCSRRRGRRWRRATGARRRPTAGCCPGRPGPGRWPAACCARRRWCWRTSSPGSCCCPRCAGRTWRAWTARRRPAARSASAAPGCAPRSGGGPAEPGYTGSMRAVGIGSSAASRTSM